MSSDTLNKQIAGMAGFKSDKVEDIPVIKPKKYSPRDRYENKKAKEALSALREYKADANKLRNEARLYLKNNPPPASDSKYPNLGRSDNPMNKKWKLGVKGGIEVEGKRVGNKWVKGPRSSGDYNLDKKPLSDYSRKDVMNRIVNQDILGSGSRDLGTDTYGYSGKNNNLMMVQEFHGGKYTNEEIKSMKNDIIRKGRAKGVDLRDIHTGNYAKTPTGPKAIDVGMSKRIKDFDSETLADIFKRKIINSNYSRKRMMDLAKESSKRLPFFGGLLTAAGLLTAPNKAEAAIELAADELTGGLLESSNIGGGDLPPHILANQRSYNAKMRLEQARRAKELRQQRK